MNKRDEVLVRAELLLEDAKTAVLATATSKGSPKLRWMSPTFLPGEAWRLYAVTSVDFTKANHLEENSAVEWMIKDPLLMEVVNLRGVASLVDNPTKKKGVVERLAPRLGTFWRLKQDETSFVVLETMIEEASLFRPLSGHRLVARPEGRE